MGVEKDRLPLGLEAFDRLRAEYEEPWLDDAYIYPPDFSGMTSMRSVLVTGDGGSGKTALAKMFARAAKEKGDSSEPVMLVNWMPPMPQIGDPVGSDWVAVCLQQALDTVAFALLHWIGDQLSTFLESPAWTRATLTWFIKTHMLGNVALRFSRLEEKLQPEAITALKDLL